MLTQGASSIETCTARLAMKSNSPQILGYADFEIDVHRETHDHHQTQHNSSADGSFFDVSSVDSGSPLLDGYGKLSFLKDGNPTFVEGEGKQSIEIEEYAFGMKVMQDGSIEREECALGMQVKKDGSIEREECMQVKQDEAFDIACVEHQKKECKTTHIDDDTRVVDDNRTIKVHVDEMKLSLNGREGQAFHEEQGERQEELSPSNQGIQSVPPHKSNGVNDDLSNLSSKKGSEEQSPSRKPAAWRTPEPKVPEFEFIMEASSWPTLAEARHAKPSEPRLSPSHKETVSISSPVEKVPSSQENFKEAPKHSNTNPPQPGSKYRSSYKKGSVPGYEKPNFTAIENIPVPPMGVHVPSANMFNLDQSRKGYGIAGMNNFFPGPHQAPANGSFYQGLAPFPHNSVPPYGRGHPGWQHHGRGYSDGNYNNFRHTPRFDQQHIGPRNMHPPMAPFMNMNVAQYNYPNIPGDMSYMPAAFSPGYNYATPYFGSPGGIMQGYDLQTLLAMLRTQVEFYFSKENLIRDIFLTSKMDEEGFVPVSLIASFPRVRNLTLNSMHILEALKNSSIVEVKNGKLRSNEWRRPLSGTSQTHGIEGFASCAPLSNTRVDHAREQGTRESKEFGEGGFGEMGALPESRLTAGSCAVPWTGLSANLRAINVPAATSIDLR